jgi:nitrogen fixation NifU-like protein
MQHTHEGKTQTDPVSDPPSEAFFRHARLPQNLGRPPLSHASATGVGSCGDTIEVYLIVDDHTLSDIQYVPHGCIYTTACASAMSRLARGRRLEDALKLTPDDVAAELGGLPADHKHCASLAVNTLGEAIDDYYQKIWRKPR